VKKGIVGNDEEEGGERAPLLDPSKNVSVSQLSPKKGSNLDSRERPLDKVLEPSGEANLIENMADPIVIDRVKGFGGIKEEKNPVEPFGDGCVEKAVDSNNVIPTVFTCQEPLLRGIDVGIHSRHDATSNSSS